MTEVLAFMASNACLTVTLAFFAMWTAGGLMSVAWLLANRTLRTVKVLARGWPPEHLDADGDHVKMIESADSSDAP